MLPARFARAFTAALVITPAAAQEDGFKSPSGNIFCAYFSASQDYPATLRCDIMRISNARPPRPRDCELDYGNAFEITARSRGMRICYSDTVANQGYATLPYGEVWRQGGFTCFSAESGVTCRNSAGGGFELSRARQRVF